MRDLDDLSIYPALDSSGMAERLKGLAAQGRRAWEAGSAIELPPSYQRVEQIVIAGMGGSAVGGDLIRGLLSTEEGVPPLTVWRDYGLPAWAGPGTLVIAISYSGNTGETLSAFEAGLERGCRVLAITSGGQLAALCRTKGVACLPVDYCGEPRTALGYTFFAPLGVLSALGMCGEDSDAVEQTLERLECLAWEYSPVSPVRYNAAKSLANRLYGRLVVLYGAGIMTAVARRWKTQLNENAKAWAFAEEVPEVSHNSIVGYTFPSSLRENAVIVFLRQGYLSARHRQSNQAVAGIVEAARVNHLVIDTLEGGPLAQTLSAAYLGDWASYYLGLLYGVDPSPVPAIDLLKVRLAGAQEAIA